MDDYAQPDFLKELLTDARSALISFRILLDTLPSDAPKVANMKDGMACWKLGLAFYEEANRAIQAEVWFAAAAVAAASLEAMLLTKMFMNTDDVAQLARFEKLLDKYQGDFGSFAREEMNLGKLLDMAEDLAWFAPGGVPNLFNQNAGGPRRPRHFGGVRRNLPGRPQRWAHQRQLAPAVQKPPPPSLLPKTGSSTYEGRGHPRNLLLPCGLRLTEFDLTRRVVPLGQIRDALRATTRCSDVEWSLAEE